MVMLKVQESQEPEQQLEPHPRKIDTVDEDADEDEDNDDYSVRSNITAVTNSANSDSGSNSSSSTQIVNSSSSSISEDHQPGITAAAETTVTANLLAPSQASSTSVSIEHQEPQRHSLSAGNPEQDTIPAPSLRASDIPSPPADQLPPRIPATQPMDLKPGSIPPIPEGGSQTSRYDSAPNHVPLSGQATPIKSYVELKTTTTPASFAAVRSKTHKLFKSLSLINNSKQSNPLQFSEPVTQKKPKKKPEPLTHNAIRALNHNSENSPLYSAPLKSARSSSKNRSSLKGSSFLPSSIAQIRPHPRRAGSSRSTKRQSAEVNCNFTIDSVTSTQSPASEKTAQMKGTRLASFPAKLFNHGMRRRGNTSATLDKMSLSNASSSGPFTPLDEKTAPLSSKPHESMFAASSAPNQRTGSSEKSTPILKYGKSLSNLRFGWIDSYRKSNNSHRRKSGSNLSRASSRISLEHSAPKDESKTLQNSEPPMAVNRLMDIDDLGGGGAVRKSTSSARQTIFIPMQSGLYIRQNSQPDESGRVSPTELAMIRLNEILSGNQPKPESQAYRTQDNGRVVSGNQNDDISGKGFAGSSNGCGDVAEDDDAEEGDDEEMGNTVAISVASKIDRSSYYQQPQTSKILEHTPSLALRPPPKRLARLNARKLTAEQSVRTGRNESTPSRDEPVQKIHQPKLIEPSTPSSVSSSSSSGESSSYSRSSTSITPPLSPFETREDAKEKSEVKKKISGGGGEKEEVKETEKEQNSSSNNNDTNEACQSQSPELINSNDEPNNNTADKIATVTGNGPASPDSKPRPASKHVKITPEVWQNISISASKHHYHKQALLRSNSKS